MSEIRLEPRVFFSRKPKKINRNVYEKVFSRTLKLDSRIIEIWIGWATIYGDCVKVFSANKGETWFPVVKEDGRILLGIALPNLTLQEMSQVDQQGYYY